MHEAMLITCSAHHVVAGKRCIAGTCTAKTCAAAGPDSMALHRLVQAWASDPSLGTAAVQKQLSTGHEPHVVPMCFF